MKNIIIDTDPGIDDAFALVYAFYKENFNILGITSVSGNNGIEQVTKNALKLVKYYDKNIKVYKGEGKPFIKKVESGDYCHGSDGLGGVSEGLEYDKEESEHAVDFIIRMAKEYDDLTLVTLGPLTNIARAIEKDPKAMKNVKEIVSMGGGINQGNVTDYAEFNYWADPHAAKIVFDFSIAITMVGLNATNKSFFSIEEFDLINSFNSKEGDLLYRMQKVYTEFYSKTYNIKGCRIHDLLAMIIADDKNFVSGRKAKVNILLEGKRNGESCADFTEDGNVFIVEDVDVIEYKEKFFNTVFKDYQDSYRSFIKA